MTCAACTRAREILNISKTERDLLSFQPGGGGASFCNKKTLCVRLIQPNLRQDSQGTHEVLLLASGLLKLPSPPPWRTKESGTALR